MTESDEKSKIIKRRGGIPKGGPRIMTPAVLANPGGRPSQFDQAAPKIIAYIRKGNTYECAAACSRVSYNSFNNWIRQGKEDQENGYYDSKYVKFLRDVKQAESDCENEIVGYWKQEMPGNWQACKEFLSRRNHASWGSKEKLDVVSNGQTLNGHVVVVNEKENLDECKEEIQY